MSNDRKLMKVMSLILLAWSLVIFVYDALCIMTVANNGWPVAGFILVASYTFQGLFGVWTGMAGVKGANTPSRSARFNVGAAILSLYELFCLVFTIVMGQDLGGRVFGEDIPSIVLEVVALVVCVAGWVLGRRVLEASKK